jgi:hypothetical protein
MRTLGKNRFLFMAAAIVAAISMFGCTKTPKENQVHVVKDNVESKDINKIDKQINTEGINPFYTLEGLNVEENRNQIPLTLSKDRGYVYYMKLTASKPKEEDYKIIKGEALCKVDIIKVNIITADTKYIASNVPFVSRVKWNKEGNLVAFLGGNTLTIYNDSDNKLIQSFQGDGDGITSIGWSPDGKKIYTEGQNLINTGIYYVDSKKYVHSYETKESLFYKGFLDSQYFFCTERVGDDSYNTVIADKDSEIVSKIESSARFRDSYKRSFLQIGKDNFSLEYYADINEPDKVKIISKEYINDAKFIYNGGFAYITPNDNPEENNFYLHIVNEKGEEENKILVSGSTIMILPEGKIGYIGGTHIERVDLINYSIEEAAIEKSSEDIESILRTLRGAMDVIYKFEIAQKKDLERVNKYFIDSNNPEQWALTDVINIFNEKIKLTPEASDYNLVLRLKGLSINKDQATANISVAARNSFGSGVGMSNTVEFIKRENKWYVTGLSTFPNSKQYKEVNTKVEALVKQAQQGKLFNGELKDKEVHIGQIQFWQLSEPHLADNIDFSNYCKVYLKVKENGTEVLYKLILDRKNQSYWKEGNLSKERLSLLF